MSPPSKAKTRFLCQHGPMYFAIRSAKSYDFDISSAVCSEHISHSQLQWATPLGDEEESIAIACCADTHAHDCHVYIFLQYIVQVRDLSWLSLVKQGGTQSQVQLYPLRCAGGLEVCCITREFSASSIAPHSLTSPTQCRLWRAPLLPRRLSWPVSQVCPAPVREGHVLPAAS